MSKRISVVFLSLSLLLVFSCVSKNKDVTRSNQTQAQLEQDKRGLQAYISRLQNENDRLLDTIEGLKNELKQEKLVVQQKVREVSELQKARREYAEMTADSIFIIFFKKNSNDLSEKAVEKIDQIFEILIKNPNTGIVLNGYSDSIGSVAYNKMISEIRANAVKSYLVGKGIEHKRILAFGHGPQKAIATNKTEKGRQLNRRVEIQLSNP